MNNILFIMLDQLRFDALGHIGKFPVKTPNIDALAASGTSFDNAYCSNPLCVPARASIMTGVNCYEHGVYYNDQNWPETMPTFAEKLADNCYYTTLIGKTHFMPKNKSAGFQKMVLPELYGSYQDKLGLGKKRNPNVSVSNLDSLNDAYPIEPTHVPLEHYRPVYYTDRALHELDLIASRRECREFGCEPFLMKLSYLLPHTPCNPPEPYFSMYAEDDIPAPNATPDELNNFPAHLKTFHGIWDQMEEKRLLKNRAQYFGCVTLIDEMIGRVIQKLKDLDIYDNTLIILTSDHGDHLCDHHLQQKAFFYECSAKVPFIFSGPGIPQGKVVHENVSHIDLYPTILDYCKLSMPKLRDPSGKLIYADTYETDNMSLMPYFSSDEPITPDRIIISENAIHGQRFMLKKGDIKINCYINKDAKNEFDYYNVKDDPDEQNNMGRTFSVNDFEPDMKEQYDRVLEQTKKLESGYYYFQNKIRPMFT
jgi:arylsulfatase A-like enzyme